LTRTNTQIFARNTHLFVNCSATAPVYEDDQNARSKEIWDSGCRCPEDRCLWKSADDGAILDWTFDDPDWIFEMKWDGYWALATIKTEQSNSWSRNGLRLGSKSPLVPGAKKLKLKNAIPDGETVVLDAEGIPRFGLVQRFQRDREGTLMYLCSIYRTWTEKIWWDFRPFAQPAAAFDTLDNAQSSAARTIRRFLRLKRSLECAIFLFWITYLVPLGSWL
jgi:hypothetical protein